MIQLSDQVRALVLTSEKPSDEITLEEPRQIAPRTEELTLTGPRFTRSFPGNSFTVLRILLAKQSRMTSSPTLPVSLEPPRDRAAARCPAGVFGRSVSHPVYAHILHATTIY